MTRTITNRRVAAIATATLALAVAAPAAGAKPIGAGPTYSVAPASGIQVTTSHAPGGISEWGYAAIGSGVVSLALVGVGGTQVVGRRRTQRRNAARARTAA